jgi:hypothetical protein
MNKRRYKAILSICFLITLKTALFAQSTIEGMVYSNKNEALPGAAVILMSKSDTTIYKGTSTNSSGYFHLDYIVKGNYILKVVFLGYKTKRIPVVHTGTLTLRLGNIVLQETSKQLSEVVVIHKVAIAAVKGDTTEYNADSYQVNKDAVAEDLLSKIPGVTVNNGTVTAEGENVKKVLVDGKPFFGDDATIAMKNLPADVIDKIQIFDKVSEQAEFTGFKDGQTSKTINIITKKDKRNGVFGKFLAGYATDDRYQAAGNLNFFNGDRRISIIGMSNNINQQNFGSQGQGGGNSNGINTINSIGMNYSDNWGKKWVVTASYFYNQTKNVTNTIDHRTTIINDSTNNYRKDTTNSTTKNFNHRFNMRMEYTIDSSNSMIIVPSFNFQKSNANTMLNELSLNNKSVLLSKSSKISNSFDQNYDFENTITYRHKFHKKGRTLFIDFSQSITPDNGTNNANGNQFDAYKQKDSIINQTQKSKSGDYGLSTRCSYTEPLGTHSQLMLSYLPSIDYAPSNIQTYKANNAIDSTLSNNYTMSTVTQRGGFAYRFSNKGFNLSTALDVQQVDLRGKETFPNNLPTNKSYQNMLPRTDFSYTFSDHNIIHITYFTGTQAPSITQLQTVVNNANTLSLSEGNAGLDQQYNHSIRANVRLVDYSLTKTLFFAVQATASETYITQSTFTAQKDTVINSISLLQGHQLSKPVNLPGYRTIHPFITYSFPVYPIKCNLNIRGEYTFTRQPGMVNDKINYSDNSAPGGEFSINSNISPNVDFRLSYQAKYNMVTNSIQTSAQRVNYYTGVATAKATITPINHFVLTSDFNLTHYDGLGSVYSRPSILWNAGIAYKFLKDNDGEFKLSVYDILKRSQSLSRTVTGTYIDDNQINILKRYLMVTFTYNIKKFGV